MGVYDNINGTAVRISPNIRVQNAPVEQYVTEAELVEKISNFAPRYNVQNNGVKVGEISETTELADNRDAFLALINSVPSGAEIYFPSGTYYFAPMNSTKSLNKDITIVGDDKNSSVIEFKYLDTTNGHCLNFGSGNGDYNINLTFKNIGFKAEFNVGDIIPSGERVIIQIQNTFDTLTFDNVWIYAGGNNPLIYDTASSEPAVSLLYTKCGANKIIVNDGLFEGYLNKLRGSALWFRAYGDESDASQKPKTIDVIEMYNNVIKGTAGDELIAIWGNDNANSIINHVNIYNNVILHDDFNGTNFPTVNLLAIYNWQDTKVNIDANIHDNYFYAKKTTGSSILKFIDFSGINVYNNTIQIDSRVFASTEIEPTDTGIYRIITVEKHADVIVRENNIISNVPRFMVGETNPYAGTLNITTALGTVQYLNNQIYAKDNVTFRMASVSNTTNNSDIKLIVRNNQLRVVSSENDNILAFAAEQSETLTHPEYRKIIFEDNTVSGVPSMPTPKMNGSSLYVINNNFDATPFNCIIRYDGSQYKFATFVWENNTNISLYNGATVNSGNKIDNFIYRGYKNNLIFQSNVDSQNTRNAHFTNSTITYYDVDEPTNTHVYNVLDYGLVQSKALNGVDTQNSTALQNLINRVPSGSVIYFPQGVYYFGSPITISLVGTETKRSIKFVGETVIKTKTSTESGTVSESQLCLTNNFPANSTFITRESMGEVVFDQLSFFAHDPSTSTLFFETNSTTTLPTSYPYNYYNITVNKAGVNCLNIDGDTAAVQGLGGMATITNCYFKGFSGYCISVNQHRIIDNCVFHENSVGIRLNYTDCWIKNCWFCDGDIGIHIPQENNINILFNVSDSWADQMAGHFILSESPATIQTTIIADNIWCDMIAKSAICCNGEMINCRINGRFSRCGMNCAGMTQEQRTSGTKDEINNKKQQADVFYAKKFSNCTIHNDAPIRAITIKVDGVDTTVGNAPFVLISRYTGTGATGDSNGGIYDCNISAPHMKLENITDNTSGSYANTRFIYECLDNTTNVITSGYLSYKDYKNMVIYNHVGNKPSSAPPTQGVFSFATTSGNIYVSTGTSSSDWTLFAISAPALQSIVAASSDFADFQTRIAAIS